MNQVSYQPGQPDAFYHRYVYDAENRITHVLTSTNSVNWDNDKAMDVARRAGIKQIGVY